MAGTFPECTSCSSVSSSPPPLPRIKKYIHYLYIRITSITAHQHTTLVWSICHKYRSDCVCIENGSFLPRHRAHDHSFCCTDPSGRRLQSSQNFELRELFPTKMKVKVVEAINLRTTKTRMHSQKNKTDNCFMRKVQKFRYHFVFRACKSMSSRSCKAQTAVQIK